MLPPTSLTAQEYRRLRPDDQVWLPAMAAICKRERLPASELTRPTKGSHIVFFAGPNAVIKLFSPLGAADYDAESIALRAVKGRLPVPVPDILSEGELEGWRYLVMQRLQGEPLGDALPTLQSRDWSEVAKQT